MKITNIAILVTLLVGPWLEIQAGIAQEQPLPLTTQAERVTFWPVQSIDTMKHSRDLAREKLYNRTYDSTIENEVGKIASAGATHVAIGTPYDREFIPFLKRWVLAARKHGLKVWYRGNFSGWEGWFNYARIDRDEHLSRTEQFILGNQTLFEDGDIFTACPECENGGPGDPRVTGDVKGHREFLIREYQMTKSTFESLNRKVITNYHSMNGDVARLVMDKETTAALGGIIAIDHYVKTKEQLVSDIKKYAEQSGGKVVLAEFGAPIPDIHGSFSENRQAEWLESTLRELISMPELIGVNYWVSFGGSTKLWNDNGSDRQAVTAIRTVYRPKVLTGYLKDQLEQPVKDATVKNTYRSVTSSNNGSFKLPYLGGTVQDVEFEAEGYRGQSMRLDPNISIDGTIAVTLEREQKSFSFRLREAVKYLSNLWSALM